MRSDDFELRAYAYVDRAQPQFAAYVGTTVRGDLPVAGMAELYVEVAPGNVVFRIADIALKGADVRPASQVVEREFGMLEVHSFDQAAVQAAGAAILGHLGLTVSDRRKPVVASEQVITKVTPYQAQLINKWRQGSMLVPSETLLIMEVVPAAYVVIAANEAEKAATIKVVEVRAVGRYGRVFLSGTEADIMVAHRAAREALEAIEGRSGE